MERIKVDAVVTERSAKDGLYSREVVELLQHLDLSDNEEVYPIYVEGDNSIAFGFIRNDAVTEILGDEFGSGSAFESALLEIINGISPDQDVCDLAGVKTLIYY